MKLCIRSIAVGSLCAALIMCISVSECCAQPDTILVSFACTDTMPVPPGEVTGLTWIGPDTLVVLTDIPDSIAAEGERQVRMIFRDREGLVLRDEDFTGTLARGLAYDGEFLWSCGDDDQGGSILYQIEADTCKVEEAFPTPGHAPSDLAWDGRYIWVSDRDSGRIDRFDPETRKISRSVITPGFSPFGLAWDGRYMWVCDSGTGRLYRLIGARRTWSATADTESFLFRGRDVKLAHDGVGLWFHVQGDSTIRKIEQF